MSAALDVNHSPPPDTPEYRAHWAELLHAELATVRALRGASASSVVQPCRDARIALRAWQSARLAHTHADLLSSPRYRDAATFFLDDLYGPRDFAERDDEIGRIVPKLVGVLPPAGLRALALAIRLDALSERLDAAMLDQLPEGVEITESTYAEAYRACANTDDRAEQIRLIGEIGHTLASVTRKPVLQIALRLMKGPAHLAGLGELHSFLLDGFNAFRGMGDPTPFLNTIARRETVLMERLFAGAPDAFTAAAAA